MWTPSQSNGKEIQTFIVKTKEFLMSILRCVPAFSEWRGRFVVTKIIGFFNTSGSYLQLQRTEKHSLAGFKGSASFQALKQANRVYLSGR